DERDALGDLLIERFHEVDAWLDGLDVHEQLLAVEMLQQSVVEAACRRLVVLAPVIDKDATVHRILGVCQSPRSLRARIAWKHPPAAAPAWRPIPPCPPCLRSFAGRQAKAHIKIKVNSRMATIF